MGIFGSNMPVYFDSSEEAEFSQYLHGEPNDYYVLLNDNLVKACGGYFIDLEQKRAGLAWGMVHYDFHKLGYGTQLLAFRLRQLQAEHPNVPLVLGTSQHTYKFYERFGFEVQRVIIDGYGMGLDRYDMRLKASEPS